MKPKLKTVYFLGAGFSADAGGPTQNQIIKTLLSDEFSRQYAGNDETMKYLKKFKGFLSRQLFISKNKCHQIALEDVFTPMDRCISDGKSLGSISHKELVDLREKFHFLMAKSIQYSVDKERNKAQYIKLFAEYINNEAKKRLYSFGDTLSIITTNWDILLDNSLFELTRNETDSICNGDYKMGPIAVVDYCCYISSLEDNDYIKPGLLALGRKGYNIKYLKLHGSMNWLHCPVCQRLYVGFGEKIMFNEESCKHCKKNFKLDTESIKLRSNLLLPTFLKDMRNIQIQLVWQNAGVDLSEATKIVFIGYSLPAADFEIRQLLSRFVRKDAEIDVVLHPEHSSSTEEKQYRTFFGKRKIKVIKKTVPDYVNSLYVI